MESRDLAIFQYLAYEMPGEDSKKTNEKIRRKLRRSGLGDYDQAQVDRLRSLRDDLEQEIRKFDRSQYYKPSQIEFASLDKFDCERMVRDFGNAYPSVSRSDVGSIVGFALYYYYLR